MSRYFAEMRQIIGRHGGTVEKLIGDAMHGALRRPGDPRGRRRARGAAAPRDARRARHAQRRDRGALGRAPAASTPGSTRARSWWARATTARPVTYGDAVNVAQRLQESAARGDILVGPLTARLLHGVAALAPVTPMRLKGKAAPVEAWRLRGTDRRRRRPAGPARALVGRRDELAALRAAFDGVVGARRRPRPSRSPASRASASRGSCARCSTTSATARRSSPAAACPTARASRTGRSPRSSAGSPAAPRSARSPRPRAAARRGADDRPPRRPRRRHSARAPSRVDEAHWAVRRLLEIRAARPAARRRHRRHPLGRADAARPARARRRRSRATSRCCWSASPRPELLERRGSRGAGVAQHGPRRSARCPTTTRPPASRS